MSIVLPYHRAVMRSAVAEQEFLPANICVDATDIDATGKTGAALCLLASDAERNAVIMTDPEWQPRTREMDALDRLTGGERLKLRIYNPTLAKIQDTLQRNFEKRAAQVAARSPAAVMTSVSEADIFPIAANLYRGVETNTAAGNVKVVSATLIYMSDYGPSTEAAQNLNVHIDFNHGGTFSQRKVETQAGSATAVFADKDFILIRPCAESARRATIILQEEGATIDTWAGPEGSSVLMRVPSDAAFAQGATPTAHAPGIANLNGDRRRWTNVYDLQIL